MQVFDNTPAAKEGTLESGDELVGINDTNVKVIFGIFIGMLIWWIPQGKTKVEVAKMIQATKDDVVIKYNKLHADPKQGLSLDLK